MKKRIILFTVIAIAVIVGCSKISKENSDNNELISSISTNKKNVNLQFFNSVSTTARSSFSKSTIYFENSDYPNSSFDSIADKIILPISLNFDKKTISEIILYGNSNPLLSKSYNSFSLITRNNEGIFFRHYVNENGTSKLFGNAAI